MCGRDWPDVHHSSFLFLRPIGRLYLLVFWTNKLCDINSDRSQCIPLPFSNPKAPICIMLSPSSFSYLESKNFESDESHARRNMCSWFICCLVSSRPSSNFVCGTALIALTNALYFYENRWVRLCKMNEIKFKKTNSTFIFILSFKKNLLSVCQALLWAIN